MGCYDCLGVIGRSCVDYDDLQIEPLPLDRRQSEMKISAHIPGRDDNRQAWSTHGSVQDILQLHDAVTLAVCGDGYNSATSSPAGKCPISSQSSNLPLKRNPVWIGGLSKLFRIAPAFVNSMRDRRRSQRIAD
jgi:hypothetical protein